MALRLALSWLTVLPVLGPDTVERPQAGRAIAVSPVVGVLLGAVACALGWVLLHSGLGPGLVGLLIVAALLLSTRGMHIDGLSDTLDGLGSYGPPQRAQEIMRSGGAGPFGVAGVVVVIGAQAAAFGALAEAGRWAALATAITAGRITVVLACRTGIEAAVGAGFGALVAGTQPRMVWIGWSVVLLAFSSFAVPHRWWQGPLVSVVALAMSLVVVRHCLRRFDGLNGDVLGAVLELTVTGSAVGLLLR